MNTASELEGGATTMVRARWWLVWLLVAAPAALAWNDAGHMTAALIAYDRLPEQHQTAVSRLVRQHPRFREDIEPQLPPGRGGASARERDRWYFAYASTWPDLVRHFDTAPAAQRQALIARFNHRTWHYINLPTYLQPSDRRRIPQQSPSMVWTSGADAAELNIVQALQMLTTTWCAAGTTDADRGLAVSWIAHLVADLHQPLHTTALFAVPSLPRGDRGGNDIQVIGGSNLHALWDDAVGDDRRRKSVDARARRIGLAVAGTGEQTLPADLSQGMRRWAKQGRELAASVVYSPDVRAAILAAPPPPPPRIHIDADYRAATTAAAERQIASAGTRLALVLQRLLAENACSQRPH